LTARQLIDVMTMVMVILSPSAYDRDQVDAIAVPSGQGEEWRLTYAIQLWEADRGARHLLVAAGNPAERTYVDVTVDYLRGLGLRRLDGVRIQTEPAANTALQAAWMADQIRSLGTTSVALTVSPYHVPRVVLTLLRHLTAIGVRIPIISRPAPVPPDLTSPESGANAYQLLPGEVRRIVRYAENGWIATLPEFEAYQRWLWNQPDGPA
jgi:hypothetical protein